MKVYCFINVLVINSIIAAPFNLSNKIDVNDLKEENMLAVEDNELHFIRRANPKPQNLNTNPIQQVGDLGTNAVGGVIGGMLTDNYKDSGLVAGMLNAVNNLIGGILNNRFKR
jgi:hypothetical protein